MQSKKIPSFWGFIKYCLLFSLAWGIIDEEGDVFSKQELQ